MKAAQERSLFLFIAAEKFVFAVSLVAGGRHVRRLAS